MVEKLQPVLTANPDRAGRGLPAGRGATSSCAATRRPCRCWSRCPRRTSPSTSRPLLPGQLLPLRAARGAGHHQAPALPGAAPGEAGGQRLPDPRAASAKAHLLPQATRPRRAPRSRRPRRAGRSRSPSRWAWPPCWRWRASWPGGAGAAARAWSAAFPRRPSPRSAWAAAADRWRRAARRDAGGGPGEAGQHRRTRTCCSVTCGWRRRRPAEAEAESARCCSWPPAWCPRRSPWARRCRRRAATRRPSRFLEGAVQAGANSLDLWAALG